MKNRSCLGFCLLFFLSPAALAIPYPQIYFLGDSLTDTGNVSLLTSGTVPGVDYDQGRFSNGPVWSELLAQSLGLSITPSIAGGNNYAYGGARTDSHPSGLPIDIASQANAFNGVFFPPFPIGPAVPNPDPNALYVVWGGANNIQDAVENFSTTPGQGTIDVEKAADDIQAIVTQLAGAGAVNFLVPNAPSLGLVPRVTEREAAEPGISMYTDDLTKAFNTRLQDNLDTVQTSIPLINIMGLDTYAQFQELINNPASFGLNNVTDRCYTGDDINWGGGGTICAEPSKYLWWDGIHPTTAVHEIIAADARAAVPEPPIFALLAFSLIAGLSLRSLNVTMPRSG